MERCGNYPRCTRYKRPGFEVCYQCYKRAQPMTKRQKVGLLITGLIVACMITGLATVCVFVLD